MIGCASERDPINRVQLNAIPKSFLVGSDYSNTQDDPEFYARSMLIQVPYGQSGGDAELFTNSINSVSKIKWQIQEGKLVGRVSFERIINTDTQGTGTTVKPSSPTDRDPTKQLGQNDGLVVYEFAIEKQFDIRRAYNSSTGEESNVIEENDSDRNWVDRDYIRVDFSKNLVSTAYDFDTLSLLGVYNAIEYAPLEFDIRNPNDVNAPQFDLDGGYFDVTNKLFANPKEIDFGDGFKFPGCMLPNLISGGTAPDGNCNPNELTIRHSFKRVVDTDYEPISWDGHQQEAYGAFQTERQGYARDYGVTDAQWSRFISRYNIWDRNHYYTDPKNMVGETKCVVDSECSTIGTVPGMSHCDTYKNKCTLPFKDRVAKPIVWHYADGSPDLYFDSNREATEEWDTAMRGAVVVAKYAECKRYTPDQDCVNPITGNIAEEEDSLFLVKEINACKRGEVQGTTGEDACNALADSLGAQRNYSDAVISLAKMKPMVMLCHSPVTDKDPTECGKVGSIARLGDLRYHLVTAIATPETNSPWGIMSDSNDPTTGEHIAASINVWTHVDDLWSRSIVDTLRYISGELKTSDVTDGTYINQWVEAMRTQKGGALTPVMGQDEIDKRVAAAGGTTVEALRRADKLQANPRARTNNQVKLQQQLVNNMKRVAQTKGSFDAPSVNAPLYQARMNQAKGTTLEAALTSPAMQQLASAGYGSVALAPAMKDKAVSIFQGLNPQTRRAFQQAKEMNLAARGACIMSAEEATAPLGYVALGDIIQEKFGKFNAQDAANVQAERADKMKDYLRRRVHYAVVAHEMGHSIALRHNFVSSSDAWNFRPQYWLLRTNAKKLSNTACAADGSSDGKSCVGPRWLDPVTANEQKNIIEMWSHSSTMEYPGEPTQDMLALGAYDFGAARMFYGQVGTVYDTNDKRFNSAASAGTIAQAHQGDFGGLLGYRYGDFSAPIHYSQLDGNVNLIEKCSTVDATAYKPVNWNDTKDGSWQHMLDGHIVTNEDGKATRCTMPKVDFVQWDTLKSTADKSHAHDSKDRVRVPHGFASDDWADLGNVAVYRHDNGADIYETKQFWVSQQEVTHIFTNYRRGRRDFSIWGAFNRTLSRYHEKMRDSAKSIALYITLARDTVTEYNSGDDPQAFVASILKQVAVDNTVASSIAFDQFAHVFARPEPGDHGIIGKDDPVLRSVDGTAFANPPARVALSVANGVTGGYGTISLGGRPIENALASDKGRDYDRDYTLNVGSYYEKAFTAMLFTESADNFISASRDDFVDPRFRSVSIADVFPDGYRRWLANNLTGDDTIKGVYARGTGNGTGPQPADLDPNGYALLGTTSWWPTQGIETCFPQGEKITCRDPFATTPVGGTTGSGPVIDPQVGWEQQKFALVQSLIYLPENNRVAWTDQMQIFELGVESDPGFENRVEFHSADGHTYIAQTYGTEVLYGKTVQKGIGARILEYANELLQAGVVTTPIVNKNMVTIGYLPTLDANGKVQYKNNGAILPAGATCDQSKACLKMQNYIAIPKLMREALQRFGRTRNSQDLKGVY